MAKSEKNAADDEPPERKPYLLRVPSDLMEELRTWAAQELRSLNAHIEYLLREAVKRRGKRGKP